MSSNEEEQLRKALIDSYLAVDAGDLERTMAFYTRDAVFDTREVEGIGGIFQGEKALRDLYTRAWQRFTRRKHFLKGISVSIHQAQGLVIYDCVVPISMADGTQVVKQATEATLWRKEGGAWKIAWQKIRENEELKG